jgi:hypothetical protein
VDLGRAIVTDILTTGSIDAYLHAGLDERWLDSAEQGAEAVLGDLGGNYFKAYRFLLKHHETHGHIPDGDVLAEQFGRIKLSESDHISSELIEVAQRRINFAITDNVIEVLKLAQNAGDLDAVEATMIDSVAIFQVGLVNNTLVSEISNDEFDPVASATRKIERGIPIGIPLIDEEYFGFQPSWLVTLVGRQKAKKSWLMLKSALAAWEAGFNVRFYSVEMTNDEAWQRLYSLALGIGPSKWLIPEKNRNHDNWFTEDDFAEMQAFRARLGESSNKLTITQVDWGTTTMTIQRDVRKNQTDVVYFDGSYELQDKDGSSSGSNWQAQDKVVQELKRLGLQTSIVVVTTTQSQEKQQGGKSRPGIKLDSVQAGSAFNRYSDVMIGLDYEDDGRTDEVYLTNMLSRRNKVPEAILTWSFNDTCEVTARPYDAPELSSKFTEKVAGQFADTSVRVRAKDDEPDEDTSDGSDKVGGRRVVRRAA